VIKWFAMDNKEIKELILERVAKSSHLYRSGIIRAAINKSKQELYGATISFLDNDRVTNETLEYDNMVLIRKRISVDNTIAVIEKALDFSILTFAKYKFEFKGSFSLSERIPSIQKWGYLISEWPRLYTNINLTVNSSLPIYPLAKLGKPLYPDGRKAMLDFLELKGASVNYELIIQVPDYRARITNMTISGNKVKIDIESKISSPLFAKFYADSSEAGNPSSPDLYRMTSGDIEVKADQAEFEFDKRFDYTLAVLISGDNGELIDYRGNDFRWGSEGVKVEMNEERLRALIGHGENLNVEFKQDLKDDDFLETVVAFANTKGGIILFGINDNCQVIGCRLDSQQLTNLIEGNLDPKPFFTIREWQVDLRPVTAVEVPEGDNKPYTHREKGLYVRTSSNDRAPSRVEIDAFYSNRNIVSQPFMIR
jgi:hypothetical protein